MSNTSRAKSARRAKTSVSSGEQVAARGVSPLVAHLGYWLRIVSNHVSHGFKTKVTEHGVTVAEWVVMRELFETDHLRSSVLADNLGLTRGAVSKLVDRLEQKALITRCAEPDDRRGQLVALTHAGRRLVPKLAALADENDEQMFGHLRAEQQTALRAVLMQLARAHGLESAPVD